MYSRRYINEFIRLKCASDLLERELFPNAKEITESMAAFNAVRTMLNLSPMDESVSLVAVGDGVTPRTAAMFAFRTKWNCYSIDPALDTGRKWFSLPSYRLTVVADKVENLIRPGGEKFWIFDGVVVIVAVHSHAPLPVVLEHIKGSPRHVVAIPCCVPQEIPHRIYSGYIDNGIWSPKNTVKVWDYV
jgi:hypothetical protein